MTLHFNRRKEDPIFLDCYTASHYAYNHAKVDHARKYVPEWFTNESKFTSGGGTTIRHCTAVAECYAKGIVIPLWGEVEIIVNALSDGDAVYSWESSNEDFDLHTACHAKEQWQGFGTDNMFNIKFVSPWVFKTKELIHFAWSQPTWSQPDTFNRLVALPAVTQFKTQMATHINYVAERKAEPQKFNFPPLTPMAMLHPMTERRVEIRTHLVDAEKLQKLRRRGGGMLLNSSEQEVALGIRGLRAKNNRFWKKSDELNKCPFE